MKCLLKAASFASLFLTRAARLYLLTAVVGVPAFLHKAVFSVLKQISVFFLGGGGDNMVKSLKLWNL